MSQTSDIPEGYGYEPSASPAINHLGRVFRKRVPRDGGEDEVWSALRIEEHHANSWKLCHGTVMSSLAEIGNSSPAYVEGQSPAVAVDIGVKFVKAPKVGDLIEVCGVVVKRTRSLVFTEARGFVGGELVFTSDGLHKVIGS